MKSFCLGYTHEKCGTCQHEKNWQTLNQMPDALRKPLQAAMTRIDSDKCRMTSMGEHAFPSQEADDSQKGGGDAAD
jgi:hypothetical protein